MITYELNFDTDLIDDVLDTEATRFPIPDEIYCFTVEVEVTPTLGSTSGGSANSGQYTHGPCFVKISNVYSYVNF